jgi:DNA-binding winged helix-turn-helix (wHTH) protein
VAAARLVEYAWGYDESDVKLLKTHMSHLRRKLGLVRGGPIDIQSVARVGYRLGLPRAAEPAALPQAAPPRAQAQHDSAPVLIVPPAIADAAPARELVTA